MEKRLKDTDLKIETEKERCDGWFRRLEDELYTFKKSTSTHIETLEKNFESPIAAL